MAVHNGFGGGGLGNLGDGAIRNQQRSLRYLREGGPTSIRFTLGRVWETMRPYRLHLLIGTLITLVGVGLGLLPPLLIRSLIDTALPHRDMHAAIWLGVSLLLLPAGNALLTLGQNYLSALVAQGVIADLRMQLYRHIQSLGLEFFTWTRAGEIQTRFFNDAGSLQNVLTQSFLGTVANFMTLCGTLVIMFIIDWKLAIVATLALPAFVLPVLHFGRKRYEAVERAQKALADLSVILEETLTLSGALVIKTFGTEKREAQRFAVKNNIARQEQIHQQLVGQWLTVVVQGLAALGSAILYTYGAYLVIMHQIALGTIVAFATYLVQLYSPASSLAGSQMTLLGGLAIFDRLFQVLDVPVSVPEPLQPRLLPAKLQEGISFEHVHFRYPTTTFDSSVRAKEAIYEQRKKPEVLHDISFSELMHGQTVIAIAHRLSTIQRANQILVVQHRRIVERGRHEQLLHHSGLYQQLYEAQFVATQA
jgi:ABC-type multidrug transport system, ATPase and permease components